MRLPRRSNNRIDINSLFRILIVAISIFNFYAFKENGPNAYIDVSTLIYSLILGLELFGLLLYERIYRSPLLIILCLQNIFFYFLRVGTLLYFPTSLTLNRGDYRFEDINIALLFIIVSNLVIFIALICSNRENLNQKQNTDLVGDVNRKKIYIIIFFLVFLIMVFFIGNVGPDALMTLTRFFISIFFDNSIMIMLLLAMQIVPSGQNNFFIKNISWMLICVYVLLHTFLGSRSSILTVFYCVLFVTLAEYNCIKLKKTSLAFITVVLLITIPLFTAITSMRTIIGDKERQSISLENIKLISDFDYDFSDAEFILSPVFQRIGYLDFASELMASGDKYYSLFNIKYYLMSLTDNILTPGFDIFDTPKIATSLKFVYEDLGRPSKANVAEEYHSDCFTIYGEFFVLFRGWAALLPIFLISYFINRSYNKVGGNNQYLRLVKKSILLLIFFNIFQSFGFDTLAALVIGFYGTFWLATKFLLLVFNQRFVKAPYS